MTSQGTDQDISPIKELVKAISGKIGKEQLNSYLRSKESSDAFAATLWGRYAGLPKFSEVVYSVKADSPQEAIMMALDVISGRSHEAEPVVDEGIDTEAVAVPQEQAA